MEKQEENKTEISVETVQTNEAINQTEMTSNVNKPEDSTQQGSSSVNKLSSASGVLVQKSKALSLLTQYSDSDSDDDVDDNAYRKPESDSSSSSSSSESSDDEIDMKEIERKIREPDESGDSDEEDTKKKKKREPLKVKGELTIDDLPPIQDLQITVNERECIELGAITTIVDKLVLVEALPNSAPLDIDSVLFLNHGQQALGQVFDVIGPVSAPIYCIRFNSNEDILAKGIAVGNKVFCAPQHSSFVILSEIMTKGSDASWRDDVEPPASHLEYSDDEQERKVKKQAKARRQGEQTNNEGEPREFLRGRRHLPTHPPRQSQNLAYPNYSWHHNFPPHPPGNFYNYNSSHRHNNSFNNQYSYNNQNYQQ